MYQKFFGLTQRPFSATPDTHVLYNSQTVRHCLTELEQALRGGEGIGLLTAAAGTGKTLLCKVLSERLANDPIPVLLLNSTYATRSSLLQAVLFELGRTYLRLSEQELRLELVSYGRKIAESQTGIALIVDEAHLLSEHILEELRALTNFMYQSRPIFRVVLSGQLSLEEILARRSLEAVNQRLRCHVALETLTRQESLEYIITRVEYAGGKVLDLFSERALELIIHASDGLPRCLNQLCDHACLIASISGVNCVQPDHVREALNDLQKLPLHWNTPLPTSDPITEWKQASAGQSSHENAQPVEQRVEKPASEPKSPAPAPALASGLLSSVKSTETVVFEIGGETPSLPAQRKDSSKFAPELPVEAPLSMSARPAEHAETRTPLGSNQQNDLEEIELELREDVSVRAEELAQRKTTGAAVESSGLGKSSAGELNALPLSDPLSDLEEELLAEVIEMRSEIAESRLQVAARDASAPAHSPQEEWPAVEEIYDHYALLDARRRSQSGRLARQAFQPVSQVQAAQESAVEYQIGQAVLELYEEIPTIHEELSSSDEDYVPSPEQMLHRAMKSAEARFDVVDPDGDHTAYNHLYSELRKRTRQ